MCHGNRFLRKHVLARCASTTSLATTRARDNTALPGANNGGWPCLPSPVCLCQLAAFLRLRCLHHLPSLSRITAAPSAGLTTDMVTTALFYIPACAARHGAYSPRHSHRLRAPVPNKLSPLLRAVCLCSMNNMTVRAHINDAACLLHYWHLCY